MYIKTSLYRFSENDAHIYFILLYYYPKNLILELIKKKLKFLINLRIYKLTLEIEKW